VEVVSAAGPVDPTPDARPDAIVRPPAGPERTAPAPLATSASVGGLVADSWYRASGTAVTLAPPTPDRPAVYLPARPVPAAPPAPPPSLVVARIDAPPPVVPAARPTSPLATPAEPSRSGDLPAELPAEPLFAKLDELRVEVGDRPPVEVTTEVSLAAGVVLTAGYVLLSPRTVFWLLTAFLARPVVWRSFDPLEVVYAWERERGEAGDDDSLESMVEGGGNR
jgi:hypothetical protein